MSLLRFILLSSVFLSSDSLRDDYHRTLRQISTRSIGQCDDPIKTRNKKKRGELRPNTPFGWSATGLKERVARVFFFRCTSLIILPDSRNKKSKVNTLLCWSKLNRVSCFRAHPTSLLTFACFVCLILRSKRRLFVWTSVKRCCERREVNHSFRWVSVEVAIS